MLLNTASSRNKMPNEKEIGTKANAQGLNQQTRPPEPFVIIVPTHQPDLPPDYCQFETRTISDRRKSYYDENFM